MTGGSNIKTLVQSDFDGTITVDDVSFQILDQFAPAEWRTWLEKYRQGEVSVGYFNTKVFSMVKADRETLVSFVRQQAKIRAGFGELVDYCRQKKIEFVIISNGLDFYIETLLKDLGLNNIKIFAARTEFEPEGVKVKYIGPNGKELLDSFKETYTRLFLNKGYRVVYIGNGMSDVPAARLAYRIFGREDLLTHCKQANLRCIPFDDLNDVLKGVADIKS